MYDALRPLCPQCGRPQHKGRTCEQVAASELEAPPSYDMCDLCGQRHKPTKGDCPLPKEKGFA